MYLPRKFGICYRKKRSTGYDKKMLTDLIAAEFKYPDCCRKDTMKDDRVTSIVVRKVASLEKVIDCIEYCCL